MNNKNRILKNIEELEDLYSQVKDRNSAAYLDLLNLMRINYESAEQEENAIKICKEIESFVLNSKLGYNKEQEYLLASYDTRARCGDFRAYCIALEWNRPIEKQFFLPRRKILEKHGLLQAMQDVADGKLDFLFVSMPPRTAKSTTGIFFLSFMAALYPDRSILGNGHSTALTQSFYNEVLNLMTSEEYRFSEIFPNINIKNKSAEYSWIDLNTDKRFHTLMFKSIDGGTTGIAEASNILYCDDLIKDIETAENPARLDKLFATYTSTIQDRTVMRKGKDGEYHRCPEIHIATRWSINDPIGRLIRIYDGTHNPRVRIINIPCYDEKGESNFLYDYGKGFTKEYYQELQKTEDPITFRAKYLGEPMERTGHPFTKDHLSFYTDLPEQEPDRIIAFADPSFGGKDYFSTPIGYQYGNDIYIEDVYYENNVDIDISRKRLLEKLIKHKVTKLGIEKNNGGLEYGELLSNDARKLNYRINITTHNAPTTKSKRDRILSCQSEIKGIAINEMTVRIYFKAESCRENNTQYNLFMRHIYEWSEAEGSVQKTQKDDCIDSVASMIINILSPGGVGVASSKFSITKLGF
jgi:hypothetical protein